ncbi:hypothetical protein Pla52o_51490 [Novipirellula galeiformis]|uniref:DUF2132 domain-containing protein n=1 Tax=Novipirellula galeiformis TaxID=2528004 RepID=A0A5C6BZI4_9BACT|nr:VF530 family protein [Novipirellula galeiformis]TWU17345.1 hypothetical protein Pla52o_51490 [Novipirellula galeiformis]
MTTPPTQPNNPLHGVTLAALLEDLVQQYGWEGLGDRIPIRCFTDNPSIKSSLKFLRKTEWARSKVERLYLKSVRHNKRRSASGDHDEIHHDADQHSENDAPLSENPLHDFWNKARKR